MIMGILLPHRFDSNEWFILTVIFIGFCLILLPPKRFSRVMMLFVYLFNYFFAMSVDFFIAVPPIDLYDTVDDPKYEWFDIALYLLGYPPAAYAMLYVYDKWRPRGWKLFSYIAAAALITVMLEYVALQLHVYQYKGWKLIYSFPVYSAVYSANIAVLEWIRSHGCLYRGEKSYSQQPR